MAAGGCQGNDVGSGKAVDQPATGPTKKRPIVTGYAVLITFGRSCLHELYTTKNLLHINESSCWELGGDAASYLVDQTQALCESRDGAREDRRSQHRSQLPVPAKGPNVLIWLRQDLRLHDNPTLCAAIGLAKKNKGFIAFVYVHSPEEDGDDFASGLPSHPSSTLVTFQTCSPLCRW